MQRYRSGHNGADSKSVWEKSYEGSNPSLCAKKGHILCPFIFCVSGDDEDSPLYLLDKCKRVAVFPLL